MKHRWVAAVHLGQWAGHAGHEAGSGHRAEGWTHRSSWRGGTASGRRRCAPGVSWSRRGCAWSRSGCSGTWAWRGLLGLFCCGHQGLLHLQWTLVGDPPWHRRSVPWCHQWQQWGGLEALEGQEDQAHLVGPKVQNKKSTEVQQSKCYAKCIAKHVTKKTPKTSGPVTLKHKE